jgi:NAD(P)-dependent dehydrogenase (short-subunit alcohol dehydrogenase family)
MPTVFITGANRGLGLEMARQYVADGWRVLACCREPGKAEALRALGDGRGVEIHALDVSDHNQVDDLAGRLGGTAIDLLINNAGVLGGYDHQDFADIDYDIWQDVLRVNLLAPVKVVAAFIDHVAASERKTIAFLSSQLGSIANAGGGYYIYGTSKAALNMAVKSMAIDLKPRGITVVATHPGHVQTDMGGADAPITPATSVSGLRRVFDSLKPADSGRFLRYDGVELPW